MNGTDLTEYESQVLELVKAKLGLRTDVRDQYLIAIIKGIKDEIRTQQGITIDETRSDVLMFVADYAVFRYQSHGENSTEMPRHLQWRLHNLFMTRSNKHEI